ncbi:beta-glucuronosyltransferase GlcAT14B-like [Diospyros lotus]|uniref:beta-glucuronosyltransferase GlcAT14B-like n=1 Tax=Diospyros lotus TaxID=55363 RepID=UPI002259A14E|nr:beta-glucuronosyltransferase GlcAT14B-like [Diospyros lotus]
MSRAYSWTITGYCPWFLGISTGLVLLLGAALSTPYLRYRFSDASSLRQLPISMRVPSKGPGQPPVLAYSISGRGGDAARMLRLLEATYHPRNQYLLQLDHDHERIQLALSVQSETVFRAYGNVHVVGRSYAVNPMGASALASTLHAAALLLRISPHWDWVVVLSASDYPLVPQDDLLHAFSFLPRDLNFIDFTSSTGWKERQKANRIVVDPSLYLKKKAPLFYAVESRAAPDAFKVFGGSPYVILSRGFTDYCVNGWDNLPRKLLMYFNNVLLPLELYFHTVLCNSPEFHNTTVADDLGLSYSVAWHTGTGQPRQLDISHYDKMVSGHAVFARAFKEGDQLLSKIDADVLRRAEDRVVPGKWCEFGPAKGMDARSLMCPADNCTSWGDINSIRPGSSGLKLATLFSKLGKGGRLRANHCHNT